MKNYGAANAVDGDYSTMAISGSAKDSSLTFTFDEPTTVNGVNFTTGINQHLLLGWSEDPESKGWTVTVDGEVIISVRMCL